MSNKYNVAVVGIGFIGNQHIEAIRRLPNTNIIAIVENNEAKAEEFAQNNGIPNYYLSIEDLLKNETLDSVHICTPNFLHYPMAKEIISQGVNVFCEKPLSLTAKESEELVNLAKEKDVVACVNLNYRSNIMVMEMKQRVSKGSIGDLLLVNGCYIQDWLMYRDDYDWHFDPKMVGASRTIADIGTHIFDLIQFVTGQKIKEVFANLVTVYPTRQKREAVGTTFAQEYTGKVEDVEVVNEDAATILAKLENGCNVTIVLSQITGGYKNHLEVTFSGSKESLTWNQERADRLLIGRKNTGNEEVYADAKYLDITLKNRISLPNGHAVGWADAFKNSIGLYYANLGTENNDIVTFEKGHYLMKLVEACIKSNNRKAWVSVE